MLPKCQSWSWSGIWCLVSGVWCSVSGVWCLAELEHWHLVSGIWSWSWSGIWQTFNGALAGFCSAGDTYLSSKQNKTPRVSV